MIWSSTSNKILYPLYADLKEWGLGVGDWERLGRGMMGWDGSGWKRTVQPGGDISCMILGTERRYFYSSQQ